MKVITQIILTAEEGHYLTDGTTYGKTVVLPAGEDPAHWQEVPQEEMEKTYEKDISVPL